MKNFFYDYEHHPEVLSKRFPHLWPQSTDPNAVNEVWTFIPFANAGGLILDGAPTILHGHRMPDLECIIGGQRALFEVSEIVDQRLAKACSDLRTGSCSYRPNQPLDRILNIKLSKRYVVSDGVPFHLLLYYDLHRPWGPFDFLSRCEAKLAPLVVRSQFSRIWIFDRRVDSILGWFERNPAGLGLTFDWEFRCGLGAPFDPVTP